MAYEPTQWRSGDTITSERLNKMEQGIAGGGSGDAYVLHTTMTMPPDESDDPITFSSVELREDGLPMWLIVDNAIGPNNTTYAEVIFLKMYNNEFFTYNNGSSVVSVNRSTGEVEEGNLESGGKA